MTSDRHHPADTGRLVSSLASSPTAVVATTEAPRILRVPCEILMWGYPNAGGGCTVQLRVLDERPNAWIRNTCVLELALAEVL